MGSPLSILIDIKQRGMEALGALDSGLRRVDMAARAYSATLNASSSAASSFAGSMSRLVGILGTAELYRRAITAAFQYNSTLEQSRIGIAALIRSFNEFKDANGEVVSSQKAYALSMEMATEIQKGLQAAGLKTTATYQQLLKVLQEGLGPAFKAGFNPDQVVKFVSMMAQAGAALSVPMDQLGQEVRAVLDGTIDQNARIAKALGITSEKMKEMIKSGTAFEYLNDKLKDFATAGDDAAKTFTGAVSNLADVVQMAFGSSLQNAFHTTTKLILDLQKAIVTIDEKSGTFQFNPKIVAALSGVDKAIVSVLGNGKNIDEWVVSAAQAFSNVATAVLSFANVMIKLVNAVGPFIPLIVSTITYLGLAKIAFSALIGIPLAITAQIKALGIAFGILTAESSILVWLGNLRIAIAAIETSAGLAAVAIQSVLGVAVVWAALQIGKLIDATYRYIKASQDLKQAQADAKKQSDFIDPKVIESLKRLNEQTGLNIKSLDEFIKLEKEGKLVWSSTKGQWEVSTGPKATPKSGGTSEEDIKDQKRLQEELTNDLIKLSGDRWTVLKNQAKKHYEDQLVLAHGNADLMLQAEKVYTLELKKIADDQAEYEGKAAKKGADSAIKEQERIDIAIAKSQATRARTATETALSELESIYKRGETSIEEYFSRRKNLLDSEYQKELAALELQMTAENKVSEQLRTQDQIFELQEKHKRDIIGLTEQQVEAEKKLADSQREIERILSSISIRTVKKDGQSDIEAGFDAELRQMDQQHNEEIARLTALNAKKEQLDEAYRNQKLEKDRLMVNQEQRLNEYRLRAVSDLAGGMSDLFLAMYDGSNKQQKEFFYLAKAAAVAQAIINTYQAYTKALAEGGIWGKIQAAAALASGMAAVAKIQAQSLAYGGPVGGWSPNKRADNVPIWATAGEFMHPVDSVRYYGRNVMEAMRRRLIPRELFSKWNFSIPSPVSFALAAGGVVPDVGGNGFSVSVGPISVSGARNADRVARVLPGEIEQVVIRVLREEMR